MMNSNGLGSDRKFFIQGIQGIGGLGALQILLFLTTQGVFPTDLLKVLIGINQLLFVSLVAWYALRLDYDRRWSFAFAALSLLPLVGILPAAILYWKSAEASTPQAPTPPSQPHLAA